MKDTMTIEDLYFDAGSFDEEAVLQTLKGKVTFSKQDEIQFAKNPAKLKGREVILLYALAKKALKVNEKIDDETFTSKEVTENTELNYDTVRGRMSELKDEKLLTLSESRYEIPAFKVAEVLGLLEGEGK